MIGKIFPENSIYMSLHVAMRLNRKLGCLETVSIIQVPLCLPMYSVLRTTYRRIFYGPHQTDPYVQKYPPSPPSPVRVQTTNVVREAGREGGRDRTLVAHNRCHETKDASREEENEEEGRATLKNGATTHATLAGWLVRGGGREGKGRKEGGGGGRPTYCHGV